MKTKKERATRITRITLDLLLKPANPKPSNMGSTRSYQRDTERGIKVLQYCRFYSGEVHKYTDVRSKHHV